MSKNLNKMYLLRIKFQRLPEEIGDLTALEVLHLGADGENIERIPSWIGNLRNLKDLVLSDEFKKVHYLPEEIDWQLGPIRKT